MQRFQVTNLRLINKTKTVGGETVPTVANALKVKSELDNTRIGRDQKCLTSLTPAGRVLWLESKGSYNHAIDRGICWAMPDRVD